MKKIFSKIPKDKLLHFIGGLLIFLISQNILSNVLSLIVVVLIGAGVELVYDKWMNKGTPEIMDAITTITGGIVGLLII